ncbi:MAG: tRNA lysidine(34) synthetase TilS [Clostridia bacterium]|nr:tRNA lysidine(34) synthetase TilS [Clostridia bacterium]
MTRIDAKKSLVVAKADRLIQYEAMLEKGDSVLVGLSGGADSVALLCVLLELREKYDIKISCAHINHRLRGEASYQDMEFVKELCKRLELPLSVLEEDVEQFAKEHHLSLENAGRQIRYRFFYQQKTDKIATAHTKDDNAETVVMNLVKGNLPKGILPKRGNIIRPLLEVTKEEIYEYLNGIHQSFVTDETNFSTDYTRNRIRLEVIPYLKENFNTNFTNTVYHTSCILREEENYFHELCEAFCNEHTETANTSVSLNISALVALHPAVGKKILRYVYHRVTEGQGRISFEEIERILTLCQNGQSGQKITLSQSWEAIRCSGNLIFQKGSPVTAFSYPLTKTKSCVLPSGMKLILAKEPVEECRWCYPITVLPGDFVLVRSRQPGDTLYLENLNIHKKLSDFFIDKKIPVTLRNEIPLITVNGKVRVVVGHFYEKPHDNPEYRYYIVVK